MARLKSIGITNVQIIKIKTTGDQQSLEPITEIGGKGVFVGEIEDALLSGSVDIAIHSLKDMPARMNETLVMGAYLAPNTSYDLLLTKDSLSVDDLPSGSRIGSSSPRRTAQMKVLRPDCSSVPIRGNVDTRLSKLRSTEYDAIILAAAGLERLGIDYDERQILPIVPAPGQGILAIQIRSNENELLQRLSEIDNREQRTISTIERGLLAKLGAKCTTPIGMKSVLTGNSINIDLFLSDPDVEITLEEQYTAPVDNAIEEIASSIRKKWKELSGKELRL